MPITVCILYVLMFLKNFIFPANYSQDSAAKVHSFFCFSSCVFMLINMPKYVFEYACV